MDLREISNTKTIHPWEIVKVQTLITILKHVLKNCDDIRVLDVGCGDAFIVSELIKHFNVQSYDGVDICLTDEQIVTHSKMANTVAFHKHFDCLQYKCYNVILILDVIEHIEYDHKFLVDISNNYFAENALILLSAPAFNIFHCSHDAFLGHFRRYNKRSLISLIRDVQFECLSSGYMFFSLLPIRLLQCLYEKLFHPTSFRKKGIGHWNQGGFLSTIIERILRADNKVLLALNKIGIKLPGLTVWALCRRQQS